MRILADENIPEASVRLMRSAGHEVAWMPDLGPGTPDEGVLEKAVEARCLLVSFDRDFGALIFQDKQPPPLGIILLRLLPAHPEEPGQLLLKLLEREDLELEGWLTVVDRERVRQRPFPE